MKVDLKTSRLQRRAAFAMCEGERDEVSGREEQQVTLKHNASRVDERRGRHDRPTDHKNSRATKGLALQAMRTGVASQPLLITLSFFPPIIHTSYPTNTTLAGILVILERPMPVVACNTASSTAQVFFPYKPLFVGLLRRLSQPVPRS